MEILGHRRSDLSDGSASVAPLPNITPVRVKLHTKVRFTQVGNHPAHKEPVSELGYMQDNVPIRSRLP